MNIIRRIRWWISHTFYINSRLGDIFLKIAFVCAVGAVLSNNANVIAIAANEGRMPVIVEKGAAHGTTDGRVFHVFADDTTLLRFLTDWITIEVEEIPLEQKDFLLEEHVVASPGDIGMLVFGSMSILASLLSFMCLLWHYAKKIRVA